MTEKEELETYRKLTQEILDFYNMDTYGFNKKYGYGISTRTICDDIRKVHAGHKLGCTVTIFRNQAFGDPKLGPPAEINCDCGLKDKHARFLDRALDENNEKTEN